MYVYLWEVSQDPLYQLFKLYDIWEGDSPLARLGQASIFYVESPSQATKADVF